MPTGLNDSSPELGRRARVKRGPALGRGTLLAVLALTALGAVLRCIHLEHPCLYGDEAWTFWRISGSYDTLHKLLHGQLANLPNEHTGFAPLLYEWDWCLGHLWGLSPAILRLIPTLCGIAMIPAMYGLTWRLLRDRPTALWTAALTACSAFLFLYSRDAKPYMPLWTFHVLSLLFLLWWLDGSGIYAWLCWVAATLAMLGVHGVGTIALPFEAVLLLASGPHLRRRWRGFVAGMAIVLVAPAGYYLFANHWFQTIHEQGWSKSGLDWIGDSLQGHGGTSVALNTLCIFWDGWGWIDRGRLPRIIPVAEAGCFALLLGTIASALIPRKTTPQPTLANVADPMEKRVRISRAILWISASILVSSFVFYCASFPRPMIGPPGMIVLLLFLLWHARRPDLFPHGRDARAVNWAINALLALCLFVWIFCSRHHVNPLWVPRYLGTAWPALAIGTCALLRQLPWKWLGRSAFVGLLALNLTHVAANLHINVEWPHDRVAADVIAAQAPQATQRVYVGPRILEVPDEETGQLLCNPSTRYYLLRAAGRTMSVEDFRNLPLADWPWLKLHLTVDPAAIAPDVAAAPQLDSLIVWELLPKTGPAPSTQALLDALGPRWTCQAQEILVIRAHWGLGQSDRVRRAVYCRR